MEYILKHMDQPLLRFEFLRDIEGTSTHILWKDEDTKLLPLDLKLTDEGLYKWLRDRTIPANRAYVENFLAKLGLNEKDIKGIIDYCHGLSLNDCYWVVQEDFEGTFEKYNLYDNRFSRTLAEIAFTGYGSQVKTSFRSSPEFTTNGMLAKCWRRVDGKVQLYKAGTVGFANAGNEPYSESYAFQVAEAMGIKAVKYGLSKWKGSLCSTCELFTSKETSFIAAGRLIRQGGIQKAIEYYKALGDNYYQAFADMIVFDAVIVNEDRHFGNFGFLIDSKKNKIIAPAPLFDHGLSLMCYAMETDLDSLESFANARRPALYADFYEVAHLVMRDEQRRKLRKILEFEFTKNNRYNYSDKRLEKTAEVIRNRASILLK